MAILSKSRGFLYAAFAGAGFLALKSLYDALTMTDEEDLTSEEEDRQPFISKFLPIPRDCVGAVLGRHGRTIRRIEFETKTFLQVVHYVKKEVRTSKNSLYDMDAWQSCDDEGSWLMECPVGMEYQGYPYLRVQAFSQRQIEQVISAVNAIIDDVTRDKQIYQMTVPGVAVGFVIGRDGSNIKKINDSCRVKCQFAARNNNDEPCELVIMGSLEAINAAKKMVKESIERSWRCDQTHKQGSDRPGGRRDRSENYQEDLNNIMQAQECLDAIEDEEVWLP